MNNEVIDEINNLTHKISKRGPLDCNVLIKHIENLNVLENLYDDKNLETLEKFSNKAVELKILIDDIILKYENLADDNNEKKIKFLNKIKFYMENIDKFSDTMNTLENMLNNYETSDWYIKYKKLSYIIDDTINTSEKAVSNIFLEKISNENKKDDKNLYYIIFIILFIIILLILIFIFNYRN